MEVTPLISINYPVLFFLIAFVIVGISGIVYLIRNYRLRKTSIDDRISNIEAKINDLEKK